MKIAAVAMEKWKLPVFSRNLRNAGYSYDIAGEHAGGNLILKVPYEDVAKLQIVITAAQKECVSNPPRNGGGQPSNKEGA